MANHTINVYLETGKTRVFAGAVEWPGWSRSGRDEASALQALLDSAPRYAAVLRDAGIEFEPPRSPAGLAVAERLEGDGTTDFGAPGAVPQADARPLDEAGIDRLQLILRACWTAFDRAVQVAEGKALRKGPRGGGRELEKIVEHVEGAEAGYLASLGGQKPAEPGKVALRQAMLDALAAAARGEIDPISPRGKQRWSPRYFTRREAWHVLDHLWEIEDRVEEE